MDSKAMAEYLDQERWLINNGLMSDSAKNQLFFCGSIVHKDVQAVEVNIDVDAKIVSYQIFVPKALLAKISKYNELSTKKDLISLWRFQRILKKEGNLNLNGILMKFIKDYCGSKWTSKTEILDFEKFVGAASGDGKDEWSLDQLSDDR